MPTQRLKFQQKDIWGGFSNQLNQTNDTEYDSAIGIDPDVDGTALGNANKTGGVIWPIAYSKFSGTNVTSTVIAIIRTTKNTNVYVVTSGGRLISYSNTFGSETLIGTVAGSNAQGAFYYNNYIYITGTGASKNDVSRYGPLDNSPTLTDGVWTGATLGSQTALTNTTYPAPMGNVAIPSHWGHVHRDGSAYFCDFVNGQGVIHRITTKKTTNEGDTNNNSAYNVLALPFGYFPTDIETYGLDLVVSAIQTTNQTGGAEIRQGDSALFFWDTYSDTFYTRVPVPQPYLSAIYNKNGVIYAFAGSVNGAVMYSYNGGGAVSMEEFYSGSIAPYQGAVDSFGNRLTFGGTQSYPTTAPAVFAVGSKDQSIRSGLHSIIRTTSTGTNPFVTALAYIQQQSNAYPRPIVAWKDDSTQGIDKYGSGNFDVNQPIFRTEVFHVGRKFEIRSLRFQCAIPTSVTANLGFRVWTDNMANASSLVGVGGNGNVWNGKQTFYFKYPNSLKDSSGSAIGGRINFMVEFQWFGSTELPLHVPIEIEVDAFEDEDMH